MAASPSARRLLRNAFVIGCDGLACATAVYVSLLLRLQGDIPAFMVAGFLQALPIMVSLTLATTIAMGLYQRTWRYFTLSDLLMMMKAFSASAIVAFFTLKLLGLTDWMPASIPLIYWFAGNMFFAAPRVLRSVLASRNSHRRPSQPAGETGAAGPKRALIVGDIDWAASILDPLARLRPHEFTPVGMLDHTGLDVRLRVHGTRVLGTVDSLEQVVGELAKNNRRPQALIINAGDPQLTGRALLSLVTEAERLDLEVVKISERKLVGSTAQQTMHLELVRMTDLIGRSELDLDQSVVAQAVAGRRVMVTGAGGTIGSELVRQIARHGPAEIQLLDCGEYNLYTIDVELDENFPSIVRKRILCSIRQRDTLFAAFREHLPEIVFHAAALKHVPLVEENACSGAQTNVLGTRNVADAVRKFGCLAMVQVSTDKAVNPVGLMGATKRLGELYCQALDLAGTQKARAPRFMTVRFGNVVGSSGSLIPLLQRQLSRGGPLTVTHPEIERYFMTVHEAVQLILYSSAQALHSPNDRGKIFVLDMGEPIRIVDLARRMIRLAGLQPDVDVNIEFTGLRPGEKLFEELFDTREEWLPATTPGVFRALPRAIPLDVLNRYFDSIERFAAVSNDGAVRRLVHELADLHAFEPATAPVRAEAPRPYPPALLPARPALAAAPAPQEIPSIA
jgi:O-antigen biosynthesis protein WbqV